jgi:hypothetical protein
MAKTVSLSGKAPYVGANAAAVVDAVDGGAAPATQTSSDADPTAGANNGGAPSAELVAAIAAEGGGSTPAVSAGGLDGGAAPSE